MKKFLTILTFLFVSLAINATEYYVATPSNGGKDTNTGLIGFPFATLNYASLHVPAGTNTIHVGAGVFNEGINRVKFAEGVTLVGAGIIPPVTQVISSYVGDSLTLGSFVFSSSAQGTNGNQSVSNIWFDGSSITANIAILVERRSNVTIYNCKFTNFKYSAITMSGGADINSEPTIYATGNQIYNDTINNCTGYYGSKTLGAIEIVGQSGIKIYYNCFTQKQRILGNEVFVQGVSSFNNLMDIHDNYVNRLLLSNTVTPTDFHIQATSPAISTGNLTAGEMTTDAGGNPIKNPPDIGAYGYYAVVPTVSTVAATNISNTTATSGRLFVADGGSNIAMSGVCWNTSGNPTISDSHTNDGVISPFGVPNIISNITGLVQGTLYHVRAYATNATGTGYGSDLTFTTSGSGSILVTGLSINSIPVNSIHTISTYHGTLQLGVTSVIPSNATNQTVTWSVTNGTGSGSITSSGLFTATTNGDVVVYATANDGSGVRDSFIITISNQIVITNPTVTTTAITNIAQTTATSGGNVTSDGGASVIARGVCWDMSGSPALDNVHTTDATGTGIFVSSITGLTPNTTYYVRAYATNSVGTAYGARVQFNTLVTPPIPVLATVTTTTVTSIGNTTAISGGNVTADGGASVIAYGVCYNTTSYPSLISPHTTDGTGTGNFVSSITGLSANTTYHVRAYATNSVGTAYGADIAFTTLTVNTTIPTVTTLATTLIVKTTATSGGNVTSDGGVQVTVRGVCWNTTGSPTISDSRMADGIGTGSYILNLTGLTKSTVYYIRAYATNSVGTAYGNILTFKTDDVPVLTTTPVYAIQQTTAKSGGNIIADDGFPVAVRGVCWSINPNPISTDAHGSNGVGMGTYPINISGLLPNTTYHARAYAINTGGVGYGDEVVFTTLSNAVLATVTTSISETVVWTAEFGFGGTSSIKLNCTGEITNTGNTPITAKGFCWGTTVNPTVTSNRYVYNSSLNTGTGIFTAFINSLSPNNTYHIRAFAKNKIGIAYGNDITVTIPVYTITGN